MALRRMARFLRSRDLLARIEDEDEGEDDDATEARLAASAVSGQAPPAGPQWGLPPLSPSALAYDKPLCASLDGFILHAATRAGAMDDAGREALLRYVLRPPVALKRAYQEGQSRWRWPRCRSSAASRRASRLRASPRRGTQAHLRGRRPAVLDLRGPHEAPRRRHEPEERRPVPSCTRRTRRRAGSFTEQGAALLEEHPSPSSSSRPRRVAQAQLHRSTEIAQIGRPIQRSAPLSASSPLRNTAVGYTPSARCPLRSVPFRPCSSYAPRR
ncbi:hypothetical protein BH09MYX1_BH09MYX1_03820 [soil metagenome]